MKFNTLENKKMSADNTKRVLSMPTVVFSRFTDVIASHTVVEHEVGRIDLISLKYYKNEDYCDYILKWNNMSNPFAFNVGDILEIPSNDNVLVSIAPFRIVGPANAISIRDQFIDTKRLPIKDSKRIEYLKRKAEQKANGSSQILPPNILKEGDTNIKINNGRITI